MKITLLSPTRQALLKLRPEWEKEVGSANLKKDRLLPPNDEEVEEEFFYETPAWPDLEALAQSPYQPDTSTANASSVAFLAEYEGRRALLAADAPAEVLLASLERLSPGKPYPIDLLKVSHHGSRYTTSLPLIEKLAWQDGTARFVISTNGAILNIPIRKRLAGRWSALDRQPVIRWSSTSIISVRERNLGQSCIARALQIYGILSIRRYPWHGDRFGGNVMSELDLNQVIDLPEDWLAFNGLNPATGKYLVFRCLSNRCATAWLV